MEEKSLEETKVNKPKRHIVFMIVFGIIMVLLGILNFFLIDMFGLKIWAIILSWLIYASFLVFGYLFLIERKAWIRVVSTVGCVVVLSSLLFLGSPTTERKKAYDWSMLQYTDEVSLKHGKIRGVVSSDGNTNIYTGIPYAKAPIGDLRWKEPQEEDDWEGVKDCVYFAPKCMQKDNPIWFDSLQGIVIDAAYHPDFSYKSLEPKSEDCLYLNVYSPKNATSDMPVLVFIHGGSLMTGSSSFEDYNGEMLSKKGIVVVTIAYRVNVFGYFAHEELINESPNHTTGNYGLLDQIKALKWVQENISSFHGDKNQVCIAGESAGSSSVSALCVSPLSSGLFKRAIGESSSVVSKVPPHTFRSQKTALKMGEDIMAEFGCKSIDELRQVPADRLVATSFENNAMTVDGYALPKTPYELYQEGANHEEALLHGCNLQEADPFVIPNWLLSFQGAPNLGNWEGRIQNEFEEYGDELILDAGEVLNDGKAYRVYNDIYSAYWFNYPDYSWGKQALSQGKTVYRYLFTKENGYMGTWHSGEMIYAYDNIEASKSRYAYRYDENDVSLSKTMSSYWANFIKTGNPNGEGLVSWETEASTPNKVMELGENISMIDDPFTKYYSTFEKIENDAELK